MKNPIDLSEVIQKLEVIKSRIKVDIDDMKTTDFLNREKILSSWWKKYNEYDHAIKILNKHNSSNQKKIEF